MRSMSLLDTEPDQPEDRKMATDSASNNAVLDDLIVTVRGMEANHATKEGLAIVAGKVDAMPAQIKLDVFASQAALASRLEAMHAQLRLDMFASQAELASRLEAMHAQLKLDMFASQAELASRLEAMYAQLKLDMFASQAELASRLEAAHAQLKLDIVASLAALASKLEAMPAQLALAFRDHLDTKLKSHTEVMYKTFATKDDLSGAVYQLTWRMAAFTGVLLSAGFAFARYL